MESVRRKLVIEAIGISALGMVLVSGYFYFLYPEIFENMFVGIPAGLHRGPEKGLLASFLGGDHIQVMYLGWKLKQSLLTGDFSIITDGYNFATLAKPFYDFHIGMQFQLIALMIAITGSSTAGYVLTMLPLTGILTFLSGYYLSAQVTPSRLIRIFSGLYFVFIPYRMQQSFGGHSGGAVMFLQCLYWAFILKGKKDPKWAPYLAGLTLLMLTISDEHQGYYAILFSGVVLPIWLIQSVSIRNWKTDIKVFLIRWTPLIIGLALTVGYGLIINAVALDPGDGISSRRTLADVGSYSVGYQKFFLAKSMYNIGSSVGPLALLGIVYLAVSRQIKIQAVANSKMLPVLICLVLGTILMGGVRDMNAFDTRIYRLFFDHVPFFSYQRVPTKMFSSTSIFIMIFIASLYTRSIQSLNSKKLRKASIALTVTFGLAFCIQLAQMHRVLRLAGPAIVDPVYTAIPESDRELIRNEVSENELILFAPLSKVMNRYATKQQLIAMLTERRYSGGYNGNAPMSYLTTVSTLSSLNYNDADRELYDQARERGFDVVVFDLNGPTEIYDNNVVRAERFDKFFSSPKCGETLCVLRFLTNLANEPN